MRIGRALRGTPLRSLRLGRPRIFYGWYIVASCWFITLYLAAFFFFGFTNIFDPMRKEFGWSAAVTALAFSIQRIEGGLTSPIVGFLLDRYGARKLITIGMFLAGLSFVLMSQMHALWQFYASFLILSLGMSMGFGAPFNAAAVRWFVKKRTRAISIIFTGSNASALLIPPFVLLIQAVGWRTTLLLVGLGTWVLLVPAAAVVRPWPEPYGHLPDGELLPEGQPASERRAALAASQRAARVGLTAAQALRSPAFWLISIAFGLFSLNFSAILIFIVPHLTSDSVGLSPGAAGVVLSVFVAVGAPGRLAVGYLGDRVHEKKWVVLGIFALQAVGALILGLAHSFWLAILFALVFGPAQGGSVPIRPAIYGDYFGTRAFAAIQGLATTLTVVGGVGGPVFAGWIFDRTGTYAPAFLIMAATSVLAVPVLIAAKRPALPIADPVRAGGGEG